jgi:hypothetical protein
MTTPRRPNDFDRAPTALSEARARALAVSPPGLKEAMEAYWGYKIHGVNENYILDASGRLETRLRLRGLHHQCNPT